MDPVLRILHLEDDPLDTELLSAEFRKAGLAAEIDRVDTLDDFQTRLRCGKFRVIVSDFAMPRLDPMDALRLTKAKCPELPFIFLSGTLGEEQAIETLKRGATDYVLKQRIERLVPVVRRALQEAEQLARRQQAEQALRESEERLRATFDHAGVGIVEVEGDDRFIAVNRQACRILGRTREQLLAMNVHDLTWPEDRALSDRVNDELHAGRRERVDYEKRYLRGDGSPVWVHVTISPLRDAEGRWIRSITTIEDISDRKRAEEASRRRSRSLKLLADSATRLLMEDRPGRLIPRIFEGLAEHLGLDVYFSYLLSEDGRRLRLSGCAGVDDQVRRRVEHLDFGQEVCGTVAQRGRRIVMEDVQASAAPDARALRSLGLRAYVCHPLLAREKLIGTLSFGSRNRDRFDAEELEILQTVCDQVAMALERNRLVEELTRRAEELASANASAEQANRAKDRFLAVLSHELRTPLTPVVMGVSMLQGRADLDPAARETLEMVRRNIEMEARLIDDLLDVTRIAQGKIELHRAPAELCAVIQRAVEVCRPDIDARGLEFGVDVGPDAPYWVDADVARLQQVFWNLLQNAVKFTPKGGCVGVRCRREGDGVLAEIHDSGIGIEPQSLSRIFEAFEQAERTITRQFGGLGLGLAISKALLQMHGGTIEASSEGRGKGAAFRVWLPLKEPVRRPETAPATPRGAARPLRILLVEDHGVTARMMSMVLTEEGHVVETAGDVATALEMAGRQRFDLLLSDLGLPDGSGHDLMRQLREHGHTFPGIALSGYGQEEDIRRSRDAGFAAHLTKPGSREAVVDAVAAVTSGQGREPRPD